jgi:SAM-dependent methyltransferase
MTAVREFYSNAQREWDRLDVPLCRIEFASTLAIIDSYFADGMKVADLGGGPGRYTIEMLKRGCRVALFDLAAENIELAKTKAAEADLAADEYLVGDVRDLSALTGQRFDGILALGPLYHLTERQERIGFLKAAKSLLNPNGVLVGAYLNAWGIARSLLTDAPARFARRETIDELLFGATFAGARACSGFTECHWSIPDDARAEIEEAGFLVLEEAGAEGFANGLGNEVAAIAKRDTALFERVIAFAVMTSRLPQYRRATDHLLLVGRA